MRLLPHFVNLSLVLACARVVYKSSGQNSPTYITGRTVDYTPGNDLTFWIFPAGIRRHGGIKRHSLEWKSHYASTMAVMFNKISVEGTNEKGLSGSSLFLGESSYGRRDGRDGISAGVWLQFYLDNYGSVEEVARNHCPRRWRERLKPQIVRENPVGGIVTKMHLALSDTTGEHLIMEHTSPKMRLKCYRSREYDVVAGDTYHMKRSRSKDMIWKKINGRSNEQWPMPYERYDRLFFYNYHIQASEDFASALATTMGMIRGVMVPQIKITPEDNRDRDLWPTQWMMYTAASQGFVYFESAITPLSFNYKLSNFKLSEGSDIMLLRVRDQTWNWQNGTGDVTREFRTRGASDQVPFMAGDL
ncbi:hypothetical protein FVEN_g6113 [Fusarium venenatum]|uniref:Choloylglycine hydrolase/NAAA C-terminal domain-containing protein n=1 Tax=Fusarium venenatum TaxID=56646 RepID=A0A2L2TDR7_9HYPO|nr:uncharacterized protein FVRRES_05582 [Fusarium venenatum]KAG8356226.1 hypothetical protein FVEN_g6113 [Fusarium venenatum]KAH6992654.1 nucleophile aminohydrolase [Fusarium venenatum]CEI61146.1 unnamed protein product [Fusarium venenatum]